MEILEFINDEAYVAIPVLWIIGAFLKRTPKVPNWSIVWVLLVFGVGLTIAKFGFNPKGVMQGVLVTGTAVLGHQLLKQTKEKK
jgi:uncharacterized membrane protein YiaA